MNSTELFEQYLSQASFDSCSYHKDGHTDKYVDKHSYEYPYEYQDWHYDEHTDVL